jgi:hypothetical protein
MMSSVIHARLEYQCGHAALVSLPRIKGEIAAQRNARVAREKSAALERQCDFCGPLVVELVSAATQELAPVVADLPLAVAVDSVADAFDGHEFDGSEVGGEPLEVVEVLEPLEVVEVLEPVELVEVLEPAEVAELIEVPGAPALDEAIGARRPGVRRAARTRAPRRAADLRRFLVEYRVDRIIRAADVRDALRLAASLGATEVLEIARQD